MKKTFQLAHLRPGPIVQTYARPQSNCNPVATSLERQQAIENALNMALYFVRQPGNSAANLWAATARANRAFTLLKQAGQSGATVGGEKWKGGQNG